LADMDANYPALRHFRDDLYACCYRRADALFELADALVAAGALPSPVHLSGEPVHRRGWGSLYAALRYGRIDETSLRALLPCRRPPHAVRLRRRPRPCPTATGLADDRVALLVRLRSGRCFYGDPPPAPPKPLGGRPVRHGHELACDDPATWPAPTAEHACEDEQ